LGEKALSRGETGVLVCYSPSIGRIALPPNSSGAGPSGELEPTPNSARGIDSCEAPVIVQECGGKGRVAMPESTSPNLEEVGAIIHSAKQLAKRYRALTGRPLGITGEVAEYEAARLLSLELAPVRQSGFDAVRVNNTIIERFQVKGRCILSKKSQRLGKIDLKKEWDGVLLVLLDNDLEPTAIYEAWRPKIDEALTKPGSRARNQRGALTVSQFKSIGKLVWTRGT
jgi:hypothetical protein